MVCGCINEVVCMLHVVVCPCTEVVYIGPPLVETVVVIEPGGRCSVIPHVSP